MWMPSIRASSAAGSSEASWNSAVERAWPGWMPRSFSRCPRWPGLRVTWGLGLVFRPQDTSDFGVDAQVEMKHDGHTTGRLVGLQIKTGPSRFEEPREDGWIFRPEKRHVSYWLNHSLPIYVVLVDLETEAIYWQEVSERTLQTGPRGGVFVLVPRINVIGTARGPWLAAAEKFASTAATDYDENLGHLAPSVAGVIRGLAQASSQGHALLLCAHLARGRRAPELTVRTLLVGMPDWLAGLGAEGYAALADFAYSHGVNDLAIQTLLEGAERFPSHALRFTISAGLIALHSAPDGARDLLESTRAMSPDFNARTEIGFLVLEHPDASSAIPVPADLAARLAAVGDDAFVLAFLSGQRALANDLNTAVELAEKALALEPDSWQQLSSLAHLLTRRSRSARRRPDDQQRAIELAERAVDQLHQWSGPSVRALQTLLQVLTLAGSFSKILDRTLPPPEGRATEGEAAMPEVISAAAAAARALDRPELADSLVNSLPEGIDKRFALLRHDMALAPHSARAEWTALLEMLDETRPEQFVQAVMRLADLGVDRSARLDALVQTGLIAPQVQALARATAATARDLSSGLPALRGLSDESDIAAVKMIDLLVAADRIDDAQAAALSAHTRFGEPGFLVHRAELLMKLGRAQEAQETASDALGHSGIDAFSRRTAHRVLAAIAVTTAETTGGTVTSARSWRRAEHHLAECVNTADGLRADPRDVWNLIYIQMKLGDPARAHAVLLEHDPEIRSKDDAGLWAAVVDTQPGNAAVFARMLDLADRFDDDPQLSGALLSAVVARTRDAGQQQATPADPRLELAGDLRARAFAAFTQHAERHGETSPIKIFRGLTAEELVGKMTEFMRQDHEPVLDLVEMIRQVRVPSGMLSTMIRRPYSSTLAQRALGYFIAGTSSGADNQSDESAASAARNSDVVADISALLVSAVLGEFKYARGQFRTLFAPTDTQRDIEAGRRELDGWSAGSGSLTYDHRTGSLLAREADIDGHLAALERFTGLQQALANTQLTPAPSLNLLGELSMQGAEPWLAPIALAKERSMALWSDDVAQRNLARNCGVSAFGTITLQQLRAAERLAAEDIDDQAIAAILEARSAETMQALAERVVDVIADPDGIIEQARNERWNDPSLAASTIGRPAWWSLTPTPWNDLQAILTAAREDNGPLETWQTIAMWGASALALEDASGMAVLIAAVCLADTSSPTRVADAVAMLRIGSDVAARRKAHRPADYLAQAASELARAGLIEDVQSLIADIRSRIHEEDHNEPSTEG
jgi:tetratricopeptide (TPR) repeat protein